MVTEWLNQSAGGWAANGTVYTDINEAYRALDAERAGMFREFKTELRAEGSD
jgi:hypothetical protein